MLQHTQPVTGSTAMTRRTFLSQGAATVGAGMGLLAGGLAPGARAQSRAATRLLYNDAEIEIYRSRMAGAGPFHTRGDAGHGGPWSPNDGERSGQLAAEFLDNPRESYWSQPDLPYSAGDPSPPHSTQYARPMHAAWICMTQPDHPKRDALFQQVKAFLLAHAADPTLDFGNDTNYTDDYPGFVPGPIFAFAEWMTRVIKARDMLGRDAFNAEEDARFDHWLHDYANWSFLWLHNETYGKHVPGRLDRDYSRIGASFRTPADGFRHSYDGGPGIGFAAMAYSNRHSTVMAGASLAANYIRCFNFRAPVSGGPRYGLLSVDQLVDHSRLFVEEVLRFSVHPQGLQGDFQRGDGNRHTNVSAQQGWLYSVNVLMGLMEIALYHARRGDMSVWQYGTTEGHEGTEGSPDQALGVDGFPRKNLHFYAWAMSRYVNDEWNRRNRGEPLALDRFYHDVIPAAIAHRLAPHDGLLDAAWKRQGRSFPPYPQRPQSQGPWNALFGQGGKYIGLIEHAGLPPII
ncbi:hypothetical protein [Anaerobaca lacustris]|uniref:Uncharacterized protein n=1 Tax=Anaerobaca lacustris TaxID=3044600 RepID=A0AAW6U3M2_9BACT|nr:hypothetical protein [Sedimentisphaerales bacterium M17dextr]